MKFRKFSASPDKGGKQVQGICLRGRRASIVDDRTKIQYSSDGDALVPGGGFERHISGDEILPSVRMNRDSLHLCEYRGRTAHA